MQLVTSAEMRRIEAAADAGGLSYDEMMRRAGRAVAQAIWERVAPLPVVVLAGPGNNGGDGLVAAAELADDGWEVQVFTWKRALDQDPLAQALVDRGVPLLRVEDDPDLATLTAWLAEAGVAVDALLGTGLSRPLAGDVTRVLAAVQAARERAEPPFVVAVDVPSGLNTDSGALDPHAVPAHVTVTFGFPKLGQVRFPGAAAVGELVIDDIGIPRSLATGALHLAVAPEVAALLPPRPLASHKGSFGKVLVIAGSAQYTGAAYLASAAAYRAGCGLVTAAVPAAIQPTIASLMPEATFLPLPDASGVLAPAAVPILTAAWGDYDAILLGPGLTATAPAQDFLTALLPHLAAWVAGAGDDGPRLVVDADGLNLLARRPDWPAALPAHSVLTPHPGEMARLRGTDIATVNADRVAMAREAAAGWGHVVVLKGAFTVIAAPDGRVTVNPFATSALAKAGTGDVLAGLVVGLMAQGLAPFEAAVLGAWVHGQAGQIAAATHGARSTLAGDVLNAVPEAFRGLEDEGEGH